MKMRSAVAFIGILVVAGAIFFSSLSGGFLFDDYPNIVDNRHVHLASFSIVGLIESLGGVSAGPLGRPVSVWSFALTHLYFGLDPFAFKAINLAIHLANGLLVGCLVAMLLTVLPLKTSTDGVRFWLPVWVAAAWLWHPIHFVTINMAVQRMTLLATFFTLLGLISVLKASAPLVGPWAKRGWMLMAWGLCWPLAFLSKETGLLFPVFVLLIAMFSGQVSDRLRSRLAIISGGAIAVAGMAMYWRIGWSWLEAGYAVRDFSLAERLMTQARVLWFYLLQILLPSYGSFSLYLDWIPVSRGLFQPVTTLYAILAWGGLLGIVIWYRRRLPMLSFGLLWYLIGHSLESSIVPLEIAHEHRNYLPAIGPLMALGYYGVSLLARVQMERPMVVKAIAALAPLAFLVLLTALRSAQMANPLLGSQIEATRHENSARANYVAAYSLIKAGLGDKIDPMGGENVRFFFEQAERSDPNFKLGYLGLIVWACASEREVEKRWREALAERLEFTHFGHGQLSLPSYMLRPLVAMPKCLARQEAVELFEAGSRNVRLYPRVRAAFLESAAEYELLVANDPLSAKKFYRRASTLDAGNADLLNKIKSLPSSP